MNKENALNLLNDVHNVLKQLNLKHFIIDGTLLGAVREGGFIPHDLDVDMGVFAEEWDNETLSKFVVLCKNNFINIHHLFGDLSKYFEIALTRDGVKCDLFFYRRDGKYRIFHAFRNGGRNLPEDVITYEYPAELIENIRPMIFQGEYYPAPADPVKVLEAKYGPEWKTPNKKWNWATSPFNIRL
jgi:hypothetical protein